MAESAGGVVERLREADRVVGTGLDLDEIELFVSGARARATATDPWRLLIDPETVDRLSYEFVLATVVEQLRAEGRLDLRRTESDDRLDRLVAAPDWTLAFPGGKAAPYALYSDRESTAGGVYDGLHARIDAGVPPDLDEPGRTALLASAREEFRPAFADDLEAALVGIRRLPRSDRVDVLTLLVALGARHDLLYNEVTTWSDTVGVAAAPMYADAKNDLAEAGLIRTIKLPDGSGHPPIRLMVDDPVLRECPASEIVPVLRRELAADDEGDTDGS